MESMVFTKIYNNNKRVGVENRLKKELGQNKIMCFKEEYFSN